MQPPERYLWDSVQEDLVKAQPRLLLVLRPARDVARNGLRRLHYIQYFERDPELAKLFRRYELVADKGEYEIYEQVKNGAKRTGPAPSAAPGALDVRLAQLHEVRVQILDPSFLAGFVLFAGLWVLSLLLDRAEPSRGTSRR